MILSSSTKYALDIMLMAMESKKRVRTHEISMKLGISFEYPQQLIHKLKVSGLLTVRKGAMIGGSYANDRTFTATVGDVMDAVEYKKTTKLKGAISENIDKKLNDAITSLRNIKVVDMLQKESV